MTNSHIDEIISRLESAYPKAAIALRFQNPLQLLVATILSAQSTDVGVNRVTPHLFERYHTASEYANADIAEMERLIYATGFYHNKAKSIQGAARMIVSNFDGQVPDTMEDMIKLPGVARKTANIVLYNAYGIIEGIAVDTHVRRLSNRLDLSRESNPVKIEIDLMKLIPRRRWGSFPYLLIEHGRSVCEAKKPRHAVCTLMDICPSATI